MADTPHELPALAVLTEEAGAEAYRIDPQVPARGWAILSGGQLWLWAAGLMPLQPRSPDAPYIYEVWIAPGTGPAAGIGAVGPAPGGTALATFVLPDPAPAAVLVTAQARGAERPTAVVLSGRVLYGAPPARPPARPDSGHDPMSEAAYRGTRALPPLGGGGHPLAAAEAANAQPADAPAPVAVPPEPPIPTLVPRASEGSDLPPDGGVQSGALTPAGTGPAAEAAGPPPAELPPEEPVPVAPAEDRMHGVAAEEPAPAGALEAEPAAEPAVTPEAAPVAPSPPEAPSQPPLHGGPHGAPAAPPGAVALPAASVALEAQGNLCPNGRGSAQLDFQTGAALITLRGLRRPEELGCSQQTGRPFNCYRIWLHSTGTREVLGLGVAARVWSDTYRLQIREGLPLRRFDGISVTAEDRAGSAGRPSGPVVLAGRYRWYKVTG